MQQAIPFGAGNALPAALVEERSMRSALNRRNRVISVLSPLVLLAIWEVTSRVGLVPREFFSAPSTVAVFFANALVTPAYWIDVRDTTLRAVGGFVIGVVPGLACGLAMGLSPWVRVIMHPFVRITYPIPHASLIPLFILIFGLGDTTKLLVAATGSFFNMLLTVSAAASSIERVHMEVARDLHAGKLAMFRTVALPAILPEVFAGIRLAWGASLLIIVIVEFVGASTGLGFRIWRSWQLFSIERMFVGLVTIAVIAAISYAILNKLQATLIPWRK